MSETSIIDGLLLSEQECGQDIRVCKGCVPICVKNGESRRHNFVSTDVTGASIIAAPGGDADNVDDSEGSEEDESFRLCPNC